MSGRIWPGALCVITHPSMFGKPVEAIHEAPVGGSSFKLPDGYPNIAAPFPGLWVCESQGEPFTVPCVLGVRTSRFACIPARWLRPILPPPGTESTEDRAPVEIVGV